MFTFKIAPETLAKTELEDCQRYLLKAQASQAWAECTVAYNQRRIKELEVYLVNLPAKDDYSGYVTPKGVPISTPAAYKSKENYAK